MSKAKRDIVLYVARNLVNGKEYIGVASCGVQKRKREHFFAVRHGSKLKFHNALRKYGEEKFEFSVLERFDEFKPALAREREVIKDRKPAYNLTAGGEGVLGFRMPEWVVERNRVRLTGSVGYWKGKKRPPETIAKIVATRAKSPTRYWLGKARSDDTKRKISETKTGVPRQVPTPEVLAIFAENMRRAARARRRPVKCLDDGLIFAHAADAADYYGLKKVSIAGVCNSSKRTSLFGKHFEYVG